MLSLKEAPWIASQLRGVAKEVAGSMLADEQMEHEGQVLQEQALQASDAQGEPSDA